MNEPMKIHEWVDTLGGTKVGVDLIADGHPGAVSLAERADDNPITEEEREAVNAIYDAYHLYLLAWLEMQR